MGNIHLIRSNSLSRPLEGPSDSPGLSSIESLVISERILAAKRLILILYQGRTDAAQGTTELTYREPISPGEKQVKHGDLPGGGNLTSVKMIQNRMIDGREKKTTTFL